MRKTAGKSSGQDTEISRTCMILFERSLHEQVWRRAGGFDKHVRMGNICGEHSAVLPSRSPSSLKDLCFSCGKVVLALGCQPAAAKSPLTKGGPSSLVYLHPMTD